MRFVRQWLPTVALLNCLAGSALALDWKSTTAEVTTVPFQKEQDVVFEFTNRGPKAVAIHALETNCSCLLAQSDQKLYAPGASGKITAKFTVGDRSGLYERIITVVSDESDSPVRLSLKLEVPDVASVSPRSVLWLRNDAPAEKSVDLTASGDLEIVFGRAEPTSDAYIVRLETIEAGRHYRLHIKPRATDQPASAAIRIYGREKSGHAILLSAYASIR